MLNINVCCFIAVICGCPGQILAKSVPTEIYSYLHDDNLVFTTVVVDQDFS